MLNLSIRNLDRLCLIIVIFMIVLSGFLLAKDNIRRKKQVQLEKEILSNRLKDLKTVEQKAKHLESILDQAHKNVEVLNKRIPYKADIGVFFNNLDALMKKRNLEMIRIQPQTGVKKKLITRIPILLTFKGSFVNIFKMIQALETMDRTVVLERVAISKLKSDGDCQTDLLASIFQKTAI